MKKAVVVCCTLFACVAFAGDVTGTWNGKLKIQLPPGQQVPQQQQAMFQKAKEQAAKTRITLVLNANKSYTSKMTQSIDGKDHNAEGTWKQSGSTLTLHPTKRDGKAASGEGAKDQTLTVSSDGKKLSRTIGRGLTAEFTKG